MPIRRRTRTGSTSAWWRSTPLKRTVPVVATPGTSSFSRLKARRRVVLPPPDGPMIDTTRPRGISMLTFAMAVLEPKLTDRFSAASTGGGAPDREEDALTGTRPACGGAPPAPQDSRSATRSAARRRPRPPRQRSPAASVSSTQRPGWAANVSGSPGPRGAKVMYDTAPSTRSGAASPAVRVKAMQLPVRIPAPAAGRTSRRTTCHRVAPRL